MKLEYDEYWYEHNVFYFKISTWSRRFCFIPRKCWLSQSWMWLKPAMHGVRTITGSGIPVTERYWVDENEFLFHKLRYGY